MGRIVLLIWLAVASTAARGASPDEDFLAAREAFRAGDARRLDFYAQRLKDHVLAPYVEYWRLKMRLDTAGADELRRFINAHADSPLSDLLRSEWLKLLGKRQQWEEFDAEYPHLVREDIELTCYSLQSRMRSDPLAVREARPLWFVARDLPESCTPLFDALAKSGQLTSEDIWARIRIALEAGRVELARSIAEYLPGAQRPDARLLSSISSDPRAYLERRQLGLRSRAERETALFAVHRLARLSPPQAAAHWARIEERFSAEERGYAWGLIGYFGALRHDPQALSWFARASDLSDLQLAWKARAALRAVDWQEVLAAIDAMTRKERLDSSWRYWKARALQALGRHEEAESLFKSLAPEFNFYGQLATEELGGRIAAPETAFRPSAEDVRAIGERPGIRRALALIRLNLRTEGVREWLWAIRDLDDRRLLAAAELARRHGIYDRAIHTAERTSALHDFELRYLAPFRDVLGARAAELGLDEAWVYGLVRQESRFVADARSRAGATGLMQLMPATAKWVARKMGLRDWRWSQVTEVDTNVALGTYYLRHVFDHLDGHPVLASAAYNAGPGRARNWRPDTAIEGAIYAETIPFNETRDYVKKVMSNTVYYAHTFSRELQSLKQRLGTIGPRLRDSEIPLADTP